jgi:serine protease Do
LQTGDVITELNGQKIINGSALQVAVSEMNPGTKISLCVIRDGKPVKLSLTVGEFHGNSEVANNDSHDDSGGAKTGKLGLAVGDLTADMRQQVSVPERVHGVVVQNVRPGSPADDAGIQPGDVIVEVNRKPAQSASEFANEVHQNSGGKDLLLLIWSKGNASYRTIHPDQDEPKG